MRPSLSAGIRCPRLHPQSSRDRRGCALIVPLSMSERSPRDVNSATVDRASGRGSSRTAMWPTYAPLLRAPRSSCPAIPGLRCLSVASAAKIPAARGLNRLICRPSTLPATPSPGGQPHPPPPVLCSLSACASAAMAFATGCESTASTAPASRNTSSRSPTTSVTTGRPSVRCRSCRMLRSRSWQAAQVPRRS